VGTLVRKEAAHLDYDAELNDLLGQARGEDTQLT
jgi:hypothetical protein